MSYHSIKVIYKTIWGSIVNPMIMITIMEMKMKIYMIYLMIMIMMSIAIRKALGVIQINNFLYKNKFL